MLEVNNVVKCYNDYPAVKGISFTLEENGVYGFLGPNGAGKSTTMNMITGCLAATSGTVKINGHDILDDPENAKKDIGYLPEQPPLYMDMTPYEYLCFVGRGRGVKKEELKGQVEKAMEATGITPIRDRLIKHLSKGYKQRVGISQTLLGNPKIIILDEPTVGLDPKQITEIRDVVKGLGKDHIVLFSSHILSEVQAISERVMIIARGEMIAKGRPEELEQILMDKPVINLRLRCDAEKLSSMMNSCAEVENCEIISESEGVTEAKLTVTEQELAAEAIFYLCADSKAAILLMDYEKMTLEDAFLKLTGNLDTYGSTEPETAEEASETKREDHV